MTSPGDPRLPPAITMADIAKQVGVSSATVSYVLNGIGHQKGISPHTQDRVRAAAGSLGYLPNPNAVALAREETGRRVRALRRKEAGRRAPPVGVVLVGEVPPHLGRFVHDVTAALRAGDDPRDVVL